MPTSSGNFNILIDTDGNGSDADALLFKHAGAAPNQLLEVRRTGEAEVFGTVQRAGAHVIRGPATGNIVEFRADGDLRAAVTADGTLDLTACGLRMNVFQPSALSNTLQPGDVGSVVIIAPMYINAPTLAVWTGTAWLHWLPPPP